MAKSNWDKLDAKLQKYADVGKSVIIEDDEGVLYTAEPSVVLQVSGDFEIEETKKTLSLDDFMGENPEEV